MATIPNLRGVEVTVSERFDVLNIELEKFRLRSALLEVRALVARHDELVGLGKYQVPTKDLQEILDSVPL